jgi:hypothetical protein
MRRTIAITLLLIFSLVPSVAAVEYKIDPLAMSKIPILGTPCNEKGKVQSNQFNEFECKSDSGNLKWHVSALDYKTPDSYKKGYEIGKRLKKDNPNASANALICKNAAEGKVVKNLRIQKSKMNSADVKILNDYYGYLGCWDGYAKGGAVPSRISLQNPAGKNVTLRDGFTVSPLDDIKKINSIIVDAFNESTTEGLQKLSEFLFQEGFSLGGIWDECFAQRESENWRIVSIEVDERTLSYSPTSSHVFEPETDSNFPSDRITSDPYDNTPLRAFVYFLYYDDERGYTAESNWKRFVYSFYPQLFYSICPTAEQQESSGAFDETGWELLKEPTPIAIPKGKVDKKSNAYKMMYNVGQNFAKVSLASDTAMSQCKSAMATGLIKSRGIPTYLGAQAIQIQSYLKTPSGFQGCLDGFGK